MNVMFKAGRIIFGAFFLQSGIHHFLEREKMTGYARAKNVPAPDAAVLGSGALLILGGLSLITGQRIEIGGGAVSLFLSAVSPVMHDFWSAPPEQKQNEIINFSKNMALLGAALCLTAAEEPRD